MDKVFDVKVEEDKMIIRALNIPLNIKQALELFFKKHVKLLTKIQEPKSIRLYFDLEHVPYSVSLLPFLPMIIEHFKNTQSLSDSKLKACAVKVSSLVVANVIQQAIDANPGQVPTKVSTDVNECKHFLRQYAKK